MASGGLLPPPGTRKYCQFVSRSFSNQDVDFIAFDNDADHWVALPSTFGLGDAPGMRSEADLARYDDFVEAIVPGLTKRQRCVETAVVHHTVTASAFIPCGLFIVQQTIEES